MFLEVYAMERREFLNVLAEQIRTRRARPAIIAEIENHIEDQNKAFIAEGMTETEAEEAAVLEMGDPVEAGVALDGIHRPRMEWGVLAGVLLISLLGIILQYVVFSRTYSVEHPWTELFTDEVMRKHLIFTFVGIFLMLLICWADYTMINQYAIVFWILINVLLILCIIKSSFVNGRPQYLAQLSCLMIPFYAGILYHFRGQGIMGLVKSIGCLCIPFAIMIFYYMLSSIVIIGGVVLILIHAAIYKKWFGEKRASLYVKLWCFLLLAALLLLGVIMLYFGKKPLAGYQMARIEAWLHPEKYVVYGSFTGEVAKTAQAVRGESFLMVNAFHEISNVYLWTFLFGYLGTGKGLVLTVLVLGFWGFLFWTVKRQKNQFGSMVSLGCVLFLSFQTIVYLGMNFGVIPPSAAYMPFLSSGGAFLLISYFYMGILLSVCNNSRVAES